MNPIKITFRLVKQSLLILVSRTVKQSLLNFVIIIVLEKDKEEFLAEREVDIKGKG